MASTLDRKPIARMETLEARTIRAESAVWSAVEAGARARGVESAVFARNMILMGLTMTRNPLLMEASVQVLSSIQLAGFEHPDAARMQEQRERIDHNQRKQRHLIDDQKRLLAESQRVVAR